MSTDVLSRDGAGVRTPASAKGGEMSPAGKSNARTAAAGTFELMTYFEGRTRAWGIFEDRFGRVRRRFSVVMDGRWQGDTFVIDEEFVYDTGESEYRSWKVTPQGEGQFRARAADCIGEAIGRSDAEHIHMTYKLRLQMTGRTLVVDFDDRIYRMGEGRAVNRATMSKWGIKLGELSLFFVRDTDLHSENVS